MTSSTRLPGRLAGVFLTILLVGAVAMPSLAQADEGQETASTAAADWIAAELDSSQPGFDQFGKAAARTDVIFALASAGVREGSARQALAELVEGAADYVGPADAPNPGALAKVLLAVLVNREDPASFLPGRHLESELRALQRADGSFADDVFTHSLAMLALASTLDGSPTDAGDWLAAQQNSDGSWSSPFDPGAPDVDVTALALQAAIAAGHSQVAALAADFLIGEQNADGSWASPFGDPNANTAGVAGQALRAAGETAAADLAADFVMSLQTADGGIRFTEADTVPNGFATLQGVLALGGGPYHLLDVDPFADVTWDHLFAREADWLGDSDVTRGCDPPANDRFCPGDSVTRGQMAAFLHRALGDTLPTGQSGDFTDTADSVFRIDIQWLAATGITRGCNPPANDRFCPGDSVSRGEMAAFLFRALGD